MFACCAHPGPKNIDNNNNNNNNDNDNDNDINIILMMMMTIVVLVLAREKVQLLCCSLCINLLHAVQVQMHRRHTTEIHAYHS